MRLLRKPNQKAMIIQTIFLAVLLLNPFSSSDNRSSHQGAWKSDEGVIIFAGGYFAFTAYTKSEFNYTYGGSWQTDGKTIVFDFEFDTKDSDKVGTTTKLKVETAGNSMILGDTRFSRIDNGSPGKLSGVWLFSNRMRNGELGSPRSAENPRKTMKILSGTRFQWIAYNVETKQFSGTGGGTYTTIDGKYTENIDFFSRDNSRVGASLEFDFEIKGKDWHHKGLSSKGDPIYEIWSQRE